jgi:hypothetical protein
MPSTTVLTKVIEGLSACATFAEAVDFLAEWALGYALCDVAVVRMMPKMRNTAEVPCYPHVATVRPLISAGRKLCRRTRMYFAGALCSTMLSGAAFLY